jgi:hypothetical protein
MRKVLVVGIASLALLGVGAEVAMADTPGCVTRTEFRNVEKGMRIGRVHDRFDTNGRQDYYWSATSYSPAAQGRHYNACTRYGTVYVDYERRNGVWKVTSKSAYW